MTMECDEGKGLSEKLEVNRRETMHATPRIKVRKDIGGIDVAQTINLMHRLEELEGTDAEHTAFQVYPGLKKRSIAKSKAIIFFPISEIIDVEILQRGNFEKKLFLCFAMGLFSPSHAFSGGF